MLVDFDDLGAGFPGKTHEFVVGETDAAAARYWLRNRNNLSRADRSAGCDTADSSLV